MTSVMAQGSAFHLESALISTAFSVYVNGKWDWGLSALESNHLGLPDKKQTSDNSLHPNRWESIWVDAGICIFPHLGEYFVQ